ncbi:MFS transporter [Adlercreutzia equolifaciens]|uniref:MFS transporter n=1 Tax=Adlercreutzia equolifaciens TaxID=446660 RepID=UPI0023AEC4E3|nr:MFS transporter [Adlercreutzia equolifaciens]MDE8702192.1 MFS transporter [Adlercreutzia equolifaciens]MEE0706739.1 MFS transporter [Adlercreutzia sp.]
MNAMQKRSTLWAWLVVLGCLGFYSIPTGVIANTSGIFVAPVMDQFGWTQTDTTMYRTIQPLVSAVVAPFAGKLLQKGNPRWILAGISLLFGLASWASAYATELWQWNLYGVIFGITAGFFMYLAAPVLINTWFEKNAGIAISITAAALSLLAAIASPVGQGLIDAYGWQTARAIMSLFTTVLSVVLTVLFVRKSPAVMGLLPVGAEHKPGESAVEKEEELTYESGATMAQARRSPGLYMLVLVAGIFVMCAAFFQQIPAFCARTELGAAAGAMAVSIMMVGGIVFKLILGALNDRIGVRYTGIIAAAAGGIGILLAFLAGSNVAMFYAGMVIFGGGYAGLTVIAPMLARESFGSLNYSQIYSWVSTGIFVFTAISFVVYGMIYDTTGSYDLCFVVVIAMYALGVVLVPLTISISHRAWKK